jgi:HEPN domain-containing protein
MRKEVERLWQQAEEDLEVAEKNFKLKEYYVVAFFCQQSVEKALKTLFKIKKSKDSGKTHSLIYLAEEIGAPKKFYNFLRNLTPEFIMTRYPDISEEVPYKLYDAETTKDYLDKSKELMKWAKNQINKQ